MKERTILFSGPMVRAILDGRKTQTRRAVKPQWSADVDEVSERPALDRVLKCVVSGHSGEWEDEHGLDERRRCPYGQPGDRLWVKETWRAPWGWDAVKPSLIASGTPVQFVADTAESNHDAWDKDEAPTFGKFRPSIFMPRWASRITLEVAAVRVERLQEISEEDAKAEGAMFHDGRPVNHHGWRHDINHGYVYPTARDSFAHLWESINGPGFWAANPWVWVVGFKRVEGTRHD